MNILCIIPARSGSKGLPNKNIKLLDNIPLLAHSIIQAKKSKYKMRIIVSTDSEEYAKIAKKYGAEVPFLRPIYISDDLSTDLECFQHCISYLKKNEDYYPDFIVHLRPTQPKRKIEDINNSINIFINNRNNYDSLRSVYETPKNPYKMYFIENNKLIPYFYNFNDINESYNQPRQIFPTNYIHNGYIDIFNTNLLNNNTISGNNIYPYIMNKNDNIDIDSIEDWYKC
jgi:CMP-N,N'-diacetyllegionaminic acid synthase